MTVTRRGFVMTVGALAASGAAQAAERPPYTMLDEPAPAFSAPLLGGGASALSDFSGRVLILTFGGLWCPPCVSDGHNVDRLAALAAPDPDVDYLYLQCGSECGLYSMNTQRRARLEDVERSWGAYFIENHNRYPVAVDLSRRRDIARSFGVQAFPTSLIIDRAGVIREEHGGFGSPAGAEHVFDRARAVSAGETAQGVAL